LRERQIVEGEGDILWGRRVIGRRRRVVAGWPGRVGGSTGFCQRDPGKREEAASQEQSAAGPQMKRGKGKNQKAEMAG